MHNIRRYVFKLFKYLIYNKRVASLHKIVIYIFGEKRCYSIFSLIEASALLPISTKQVKGKNIIYMMFDGRIDQAGLADNLRAIASVYYLCKQKSLDLKVIFNYPFCLNKFLIPNQFNWELNPDDNSYLSEDAKDIAALSYRNIFKDSNIALQRSYLEDLLVNIKKPVRLYTNTYCHDDFFEQSYHELFKPSPLLSKLIVSQTQMINGKYISASFRFTNLLGDIDDNFGKELSQKEKEDLMEQCSNSIVRLHSLCPDYKILVTSDSSSYLNYITQLYDYTYVVPGEIGHVGHNGDDAIVVKTFLDLYMISQAESVYMIRTPIMYKSGFAKRAAMIGGKPFNEILI